MVFDLQFQKHPTLHPSFLHLNKTASVVTWVVQQNMINDGDLKAMKMACLELNLFLTPVDVIPFSSQLPEFEISPYNIYHGTTTFSDLLLNDIRISSGHWYDEERYTMQNYLEHWKGFMLNSEAEILTLLELLEMDGAPSRDIFIRPNADDKAFAGTVMPLGDVQAWFNRVKGMSNEKLNSNTKLVVSPPYRIKTEWRLWMVMGKMVAASQYRQDFKLSKKEGCPLEVQSFAQERCKEYLLDEVFVMDICKSGDSLYILECGCMNNAGFYSANLKEMMGSISDYVIQKNKSST